MTCRRWEWREGLIWRGTWMTFGSGWFWIRMAPRNSALSISIRNGHSSILSYFSCTNLFVKQKSHPIIISNNKNNEFTKMSGTMEITPSTPIPYLATTELPVKDLYTGFWFRLHHSSYQQRPIHLRVNRILNIHISAKIAFHEEWPTRLWIVEWI